MARRRGRVRSRLMIEMADRPRDLASLVVLPDGSLEATGDPFEPYRLKDGSEATVAPVAAYLRDLQACGRPATTQRSYGIDLPRWFLFLPAAGVGWDQATQAEARDFISWPQVTGKPGRAATSRAASTVSRASPCPALSTPRPRSRIARRCCVARQHRHNPRHRPCGPGSPVTPPSSTPSTSACTQDSMIIS